MQRVSQCSVSHSPMSRQVHCPRHIKHLMNYNSFDPFMLFRILPILFTKSYFFLNGNFKLVEAAKMLVSNQVCSFWFKDAIFERTSNLRVSPINYGLCFPRVSIQLAKTEQKKHFRWLRSWKIFITYWLVCPPNEKHATETCPKRGVH